MSTTSWMEQVQKWDGSGKNRGRRAKRKRRKGKGGGGGVGTLEKRTTRRIPVPIS